MDGKTQPRWVFDRIQQPFIVRLICSESSLLLHQFSHLFFLRETVVYKFLHGSPSTQMACMIWRTLAHIRGAFQHVLHVRFRWF